jgi:hypothetical protein
MIMAGLKKLILDLIAILLASSLPEVDLADLWLEALIIELLFFLFSYKILLVGCIRSRSSFGYLV